MEPAEQPLCCCEYINSRGERAHLFGLFCDCTEVDDFVDRVVKGLPVSTTRNEEILATLEDRYFLRSETVILLTICFGFFKSLILNNLFF